MRGRTVRTYEKGERLLNKLRQGLSIGAACKAEQIGRATYYDWRAADPEFAAAADAAIEDGTDAIEDALTKRAKKDDTTAAIFLLKARRPAKYRETVRQEHTGADGQPIVISFPERSDGPQ